jgi:hypothetical protein
VERRSFLRGIVLGSAAAAANTALVQLASASEVASLVAQPEVVVGPQLKVSGGMPGAHWLNGPIYVEGPAGFEPIGYLTSVNVTTAVDSIVEWDGSVTFMPSLKHATGSFRGPY